MLRLAVMLLGLFMLTSSPALTETYYVAPLGTQSKATPDGSEGLPFLSIEAAFASGKVKGGDTLLLKDGAYGPLIIKANASFDTPVTITSQNAKAAHFDSILLAQNTRNLVFRNLSVWPRNRTTLPLYLVRAYKTTSEITLDGLDIRSDQSAYNYMAWSAEEWASLQVSGVLLEGSRNLVVRNRLTGVLHGIFVVNDSSIISNTVDGFNGDGLRAFNGSTVRGNTIQNCVELPGDTNHDDGFQSFSTNGYSAAGLIIESNVILEWTGDPNHALRCKLQGIGMFDGPYDNLTIANNVVSTSRYHGISVYGARGAKIVNNTVVNALGITGIYPYIAVRPQRDGTMPVNVLLANNIAMSFQGTADSSRNVVFLRNAVVGTPFLVFEDPVSFDYRPKISTGFIDAGDPASAPAKDVLGLPRPSGAGPDLGAYELQTVVPATPGPAPVTSGPKTIKPTKPDKSTPRIMLRKVRTH